MFARIENGVVVAYPVDPRAEQPNTSFPSNWTGGSVNGAKYVRVTPVDVPQVDYTKIFTESMPTLINGVWTQTWIVTDATAEQVLQRLTEMRAWMVVSPLQMRRALRQQGLADAVAAYVAAQDVDTQDAWEYAVEIRRTDALIVQAASALGKTEAEIDDLFRLAATF